MMEVRMRLAEEPWEVQEGHAGTVWVELGRLRRRALARPWRPLIYALLATALLVGWRARKHKSFTSRVMFRVTEEDIDATTAPRPARALREYVSEVPFSTPRLIEVAKRHGLYETQMARDPIFAIESMREDIDVQVWRNYFVEDRAALDAGRSARLAISFSAKTPEQSLAVARDLGQLVIEVEQKARVQMAEAAARAADHDLQAAREQ